MVGTTSKANDLSTADAINNSAFVQNATGADAVLTINQAGNTSFGGVIRDNPTSNKLGITKAGAGTLTLSNSNTYSGATTISAGTLSVANTSNLGASAANLVFDGGTLRITGTTLANFSGIGHTVVFNSGKTVGLDINSSANTFTANQSMNQGAGGLTKSGSGMLILPVANTYTGETRINAGTLRVDNTSALSGSNSIGFGNIAGGAATLNNNTGGTLTLDKAFFRGNGNSISGFVTGGAIVFNGLAANALNSNLCGLGVNNAGVTFAGGLQLVGDTQADRNFTLSGSGSILISGSVVDGLRKGSLTYNGSGTLTLDGSNTYTGMTTVSNGTLNFGVSETLSGGLTIATTGTAVLTAHTGTVKVLDITGLTISGTTAFAGSGAKDGSTTADANFGSVVDSTLDAGNPAEVQFAGASLASPVPVPEPGTIGLLAVGAVGGLLLRRRSRA